MEYIQIAATVMSAIGALNQGQQQSSQYQHAADIARYNEAVGRSRAQSALDVGNQKEEMQRRQARLVIGQQRAASAQSGFGFSGSALDVERQSQVMAELDALNIRYGAQLEAQGFKSQADLDASQADVYDRSSSNARKGSYLGAAAAALSGTADYLRMTKKPDARGTPRVAGIYDTVG